MPMREVHQRYTKSELAVMAWRSQELNANMRNKVPSEATPRKNNVTSIDRRIKQSYGEDDPDVAGLEERLGPVAERLGEDLDLRKLTGSEAVRFLTAQGMHIPMMGPRSKG